MKDNPIEIQNIVTKYCPPGQVFVYEFKDYPFISNIKIPLVKGRYYVVSEKKLSHEEDIIYVTRFIIKKIENGDEEWITMN